MTMVVMIIIITMIVILTNDSDDISDNCNDIDSDKMIVIIIMKMLCRAGETASSLTIKNEMLSLTLNFLSNLLKA